MDNQRKIGKLIDDNQYNRPNENVTTTYMIP